MYRVLLLGAGKIGRMITRLLSDTGDYQLLVADANEDALKRLDGWERVETRTINADDAGELAEAMKDCDACISALSFYLCLIPYFWRMIASNDSLWSSPTSSCTSSILSCIYFALSSRRSYLKLSIAWSSFSVSFSTFSFKEKVKALVTSPRASPDFTPSIGGTRALFCACLGSNDDDGFSLLWPGKLDSSSSLTGF